MEREEKLQLRDFPTLTHVIGWMRDKTGIAAPARRGAGGVGRARSAQPAARQPPRRPPPRRWLVAGW